jgi:hypothetical protein
MTEEDRRHAQILFWARIAAVAAISAAIIGAVALTVAVLGVIFIFSR